jgi:ParB family chromosome partitioning protein
MDNSKRNVHNSGPLGMLVKTGQIKKVDLSEEPTLQHVGLEGLKSAGSYFKTQSGIQFKENELMHIDPKECEPWEYANRSEEEMGNIEELMQSIQENTQLQPALVRIHPNPHGEIKYQVIFGRRRHVACLKLQIPFLVIKKDKLTLPEAIACQDAENKFRKDISNYSNALLYKKLLDNKAFKTEKELAQKLNMSTSSLSDLMTYAKLPKLIVERIPNIHELPVYMAIKIMRLLTLDDSLFEKILEIAPQIGNTIKTPAKLETAVKATQDNSENVLHGTRVIKDETGAKLFSFKVDHKGIPSIIFHKDLLRFVDFEVICDELENLVKAQMKSGRSE